MHDNEVGAVLILCHCKGFFLKMNALLICNLNFLAFPLDRTFSLLLTSLAKRMVMILELLYSWRPLSVALLPPRSPQLTAPNSSNRDAVITALAGKEGV